MIEYTYAPDRFSHAAAICPFDGGVLTAMYSGTQECHPSQRVYLYWSGNGTMKGPIPLESLTGNPILFQNKGMASIIYSKFEEFPTQRAHWWQHCTLWQRQIENFNGMLKLSEPKQLIVEEDEENPAPGRGYLPRCNPIHVVANPDDLGTWYLPLYREQAPHFYGVIMKSEDGKNWEHYGNIGKEKTRCIQPTIWHKDGKLHALLRNFNFSSRKQRYAYYSSTTLTAGSPEWSDPVDSGIFNANNSLVVCNSAQGDQFETPLYVWNHDPRGRNNISLGGLGTGKVLVKLDDYGSYPAVCADWDDLHILYTAKANRLQTPKAATVIKHKVYNIPALKSALQK